MPPIPTSTATSLLSSLLLLLRATCIVSRPYYIASGFSDIVSRASSRSIFFPISFFSIASNIVFSRNKASVCLFFLFSIKPAVMRLYPVKLFPEPTTILYFLELSTLFSRAAGVVFPPLELATLPPGANALFLE